LYFAQLIANSYQPKQCSFYFLLFSYLNMSMNVNAEFISASSGE
jgi:hypothetical protein